MRKVIGSEKKGVRFIFFVFFVSFKVHGAVFCILSTVLSQERDTCLPRLTPGVSRDATAAGACSDRIAAVLKGRRRIDC